MLLQQNPLLQVSMSHHDKGGSHQYEHHMRNLTDGHPKETRSLASRRPQSPFMSSAGDGSQAKIPPVTITSERLPRPNALGVPDATSPTPAMTAALDAMSIDSPTSAVTREFFTANPKTLTRSRSVNLPSAAGLHRLSLQTNLRGSPASVGRVPSKSPHVRSPLSKLPVGGLLPRKEGVREHNFVDNRGIEQSRAAYPVMYKPSPETTAPLIPNPLHPKRLGQLPVIYTRDRLKQLGRRFLFDSKSADAFIRAVPLHQTSPHASPGRECSETESVRIRILPCSPVRRPFCISKKFPMRPHHHQSPPPSTDASSTGSSKSYRIEKRHGHHNHHHHHHHHRGSNNSMLEVPDDKKSRRRSESDVAAMLRGSNVLDIVPAKNAEPRGLKVALPEYPIHIEYALYRVPLLAAILNSGFVHNGDTVEVPLPSPDAWEDTVKWIYLFGFGNEAESERDDELKQSIVADVEKREKVKHNIEYLGGKLD